MTAVAGPPGRYVALPSPDVVVSSEVSKGNPLCIPLRDGIIHCDPQEHVGSRAAPEGTQRWLPIHYCLPRAPL